MTDLLLARHLVDLRDTAQKLRIEWGNRLKAIDSGRSQNPYRFIVEKYYNAFQAFENELNGAIQDFYDVPIIERMTKIKGVGTLMAVKIASQIDIQKADTISALWRYAGYSVKDGKRERLKKGEKSHYNKRLKTDCYRLFMLLIRKDGNSPYRSYYLSQVKRYEETRPEWTKYHIHLAASSKTIKLFLSHLWLVWREMEGLPVTRPYVHDKLNHNTFYSPEDFGW